MRAVLLALLATTAFAHDAPDDEDATKVIAALKEAGCSANAEDILTHDGGFEVFPATCTDGDYFIVVDGVFKITKKIKQ